MTSLFATTILNVLGTNNLGTQQAANCYQVPKYAASLYGGCHIVIKPRRACTARVTVLGLCVCLCACVCVCMCVCVSLLLNISLYT